MLYTHQGRVPKLATGAWVAPDATVIGDVEIAESASVWFQTVVRGDVCYVRIGARTNIQDHSTVHGSSDGTPTVVEADVTIGHRVVLHACTVKAGSLIGIGAIVLDRAVIGEGSLVAAGSVVTPGTVIPPASVVMGAPAKVIRAVGEAERRFIDDTTARYVGYAREYARAV